MGRLITRRKKRVTLADIAREAGVSVSTVSAICSGNQSIRISEATQQRVSALAAKLNYRPRPRNMSRNGLLTVRVFTFYASDVDMQLQILSGIENALLAVNGRMNVSMSDESLAYLRDKPDAFLEGVDGVIFTSRADPMALEAIRKRNIPAVIVGSGELRDDLDMVYPQPLGYVDKGLAYLAGLGHKDIAFVTGPLPHYVHETQVMYFRELARKYGLQGADGNIEILVSCDTVKDAVHRLLQREQHRPTAIMGQVGVGKTPVETLGLDVPSELSLLSFDKGSTAGNLSFVGADNRQLGMESVRLLMMRRTHPALAFRHVVLPVTVHDCGSCGSRHA